jgi:hypothetical protein
LDAAERRGGMGCEIVGSWGLAGDCDPAVATVHVAAGERREKGVRWQCGHVGGPGAETNGRER